MAKLTIGSPTRRGLNTVQAFLRLVLWLVSMAVFFTLTVLLSVALGRVAEFLGPATLAVGGVVSLILALMVSRTLYVIPEFQRVVLLRLGKFIGVKGPGLFWVIPYPPFFRSVAAMLDIRVQTRIIKAAETLTSDNVPVGCEAVIFMRVEDPERAALHVEDYSEAVFQAANSALKDTVGNLELTDLLSNREMVAERLKTIIDSAAKSFGVDVSSVEITDVRVPADLIQELSVIAQSRRAAQAKIAEADAEKAIAGKLQEASQMLTGNAMEMYRLNVLERLGREEGSQIVVYGMGGSDPVMERTIAASSAGAMTGQSQTQRSGWQEE
jgi:regulator of protease activity HflC (stomatin/prohibitin superfamily)